MRVEDTYGRNAVTALLSSHPRIFVIFPLFRIVSYHIRFNIKTVLGCYVTSARYFLF